MNAASGLNRQSLRAAVMTPSGRGAVATILVEGDPSPLDGVSPPVFLAANGKPINSQPIGRICYGQWGVEPGESVVVCRKAPDQLEVHCHGGRAAIDRILTDLAALGWQTHTGHAPSTLSTLDRECAEALMRATTRRTAAVLLEQQSGLLRSTVEELLQHSGDEATLQLEELLRWGRFGLHLTQPWRVALIGRPNVGKSSLINALLGYTRSIVYDQPGTTRDIVTGETAFDGWPVELCDTAGLRAAEESLEAQGISKAREILETADLRLILLDRSEPIPPEDVELIATWPESLVVINKVDLPPAWTELEHPSVTVSATTGEGIDDLARQMMQRLIPEVPSEGTAIPVAARQISRLQEAARAFSENDREAFEVAILRCLEEPQAD
ncbi:tRNA modification GTPase MnmE [Maioricimonas rarisocia]|uniref:tRNA modification GTPase MnmE n=1 Tax=Maioricimonas rarisocia TaxID=2528026 RepID=A0A517Z9Q4_9PLAN|nr:GTPase [Maioricimonas rarisocia]QDU39160.1 tRNA modification GTPase MnmE [Maioricimonas rarisocia]